jgi:hypothetical protein
MENSEGEAVRRAQRFLDLGVAHSGIPHLS